MTVRRTIIHRDRDAVGGRPDADDDLVSVYDNVLIKHYYNGQLAFPDEAAPAPHIDIDTNEEYL